MGKRILVITDKTDGLWLGKSVSNDNYDLLTLGFSAEAARFLYRSEAIKFNLIDVGAFAEKAQEKVRQFIPRFIYDFARKDRGWGRSILKHFQVGKVNFWWFNKMSEKGGWGTPLIRRVYYLELIIEAFQGRCYEEMWVELEDAILAAQIKDNQDQLCTIKILTGNQSPLLKNKYRYLQILIRNLFIQQIGILLRRLILGFMGAGKQVKNGSVMLFTLYPYFWSKLTEAGRQELFYRTLPFALGSRPISYLAWLTISFDKLRGKRRAIAKDLQDQKVIPLEKTIGLRGILRVFSFSLAYLLKIISYLISLRGNIREHYGKVEITRMVLDEFEQFMIAPEIIMSLGIMEATKEFLENNKPGCLIFRAEFQPHERGLLYAAHGRCLTIGFQHQAIARNHLQYFFLPEELAAMPLPDKILVAGEYPREVLIKGGFPADKVTVCGPVRYAELVKQVRNRKSKGELRAKFGLSDAGHIFLIAAPVVKSDAINFGVLLGRAAQRNLKGAIFLVKSHPITKYDDLIKSIVKELAPELDLRFLPDCIDLNEYLVLADALILTGSTVGIEAICLGIVPILLENYHSFSLNPLLEIEDSYLKVTDPNQLNTALEMIVNDDGRLGDLKRNWPGAIRKLFYSIEEDPGKRFAKILEGYGVLPE